MRTDSYEAKEDKAGAGADVHPVWKGQRAPWPGTSVGDTAGRQLLHELCCLPVPLSLDYQHLVKTWFITGYLIAFILTHWCGFCPCQTIQRPSGRKQQLLFNTFLVVCVVFLNRIFILEAHMSTFPGSFPEITMERHPPCYLVVRSHR